MTRKRPNDVRHFASGGGRYGESSETACLPMCGITNSANKPPGTPPATEYPYVAAMPDAIDVSIVTRFIFHPLKPPGSGRSV